MRLDESTKARFWSKVDVRSGTECWPWRASKRNGYGQFGIREGVVRGAHVVAYEILIGPIPKGLTLDHLCHGKDCRLGARCPHRACCNPAHAEPCARGENVLRGNGSAASRKNQTHCVHGHPFTEKNTYRDRMGYRHCRICSSTRSRVKYLRNKALYLNRSQT